MIPLTFDTLRGTWGTLLLPLTHADEIDFAALGRQLDTLVASGLDGIYAHGSAGEFSALSEDEYDRINLLLAERCTQAGVPFQIGACHLHSREALARARRAAALHPGAIQVVLPDWITVNLDEAADFLERIAEAVHPVPLVIYNPRHAKRQLAAEEFAALQHRIPAVIGVKVSRDEPTWYAGLRAAAPRLALFAPGPSYASAVLEWGAHGSYSLLAAVHPGFAVSWQRTIRGDPTRALAAEALVKRFLAVEVAPLRERLGLAANATDKFLAAAAGWTPIATRMRWPHRGVPEGYVANFRPIIQRFLREAMPGMAAVTPMLSGDLLGEYPP